MYAVSRGADPQARHLTRPPQGIAGLSPLPAAPGLECFPLVTAEFAHRAGGAFRFACLAHVAAVQNEPVVGVAAPALGHHLLEAQLDRVRCLRGCEAGAVGDPEDVGIDGDGALAEGLVQK